MKVENKGWAGKSYGVWDVLPKCTISFNPRTALCPSKYLKAHSALPGVRIWVGVTSAQTLLCISLALCKDLPAASPTQTHLSVSRPGDRCPPLQLALRPQFPHGQDSSCLPLRDAGTLPSLPRKSQTSLTVSRKSFSASYSDTPSLQLEIGMTKELYLFMLSLNLAEKMGRSRS